MSWNRFANSGVVTAAAAMIVVTSFMANAMGSGADGEGSDRPERPGSPTSFTDRRSEMPSLSVDEAVKATLGGLDRDRFVSLTMGQAPTPNAWQGNWVYGTVRGDESETGPNLAGIWQVDLAQGAIAERIAGNQRNLADVVRGSMIEVQTSGGQLLEIAGGAGDIAPGQSFGSGLSDGELLTHARSVAERYGVDVTDVRLYHPLDRALSIIVRVPDLKAFGGQFEALRNDLFGSGMFEGIYLELTSPEGDPLLRSSTGYRSGAGRLWFAPGMDEVLGAVHGSVPASLGKQQRVR